MFMDVCVCVCMCMCVCVCVAAQRDFFDSFERAALSVPAVRQTYRHDSHRRRRRKIFADESGEQDVELDGRRKFQVETFNVAIDTLTQSLGHRLEAYRHLCSLFSVLFCEKSESNASVIEKAKVLASAYPSDLDDSLGDSAQIIY